MKTRCNRCCGRWRLVGVSLTLCAPLSARAHLVQRALHLVHLVVNRGERRLHGDGRREHHWVDGGGGGGG